MRSIRTVIKVLSVFLVLALISSGHASIVERILVHSGQLETLPINLLSPQVVSGSFNISAIENNATVDFWVINPNGKTILDAETAANGQNFTFTAVTDGKYVLNFKNHLQYDENISLDYSVSSPPSRIMGVDPLFFVGTILEAVIVLAIVAYFIYRIRAGRRKS
jgi:hypothetical protein